MRICQRRSGMALLAALALSPGIAQAQATVDVVREFKSPAYRISGRLLELPGGRLIGAAEEGGGFGRGAVLAFDRQPDGTLTSTVLHAFSGPDGALPMGGVILGRDGALYGTTHLGGPEDRGVIYRLHPDGSAFEVVNSFRYETGGRPRASLMQAADGRLYGTTTEGFGTAGIFRATTDGDIALLHAFDHESDAVHATDPLIEGPHGALYGVTTAGGPQSAGMMYRISADGTFTVVHAFTPGGIAGPTNFIDGRDGFFYGTGVNSSLSAPAIFRISPAGVLSVLHTGDAAHSAAFNSLVRGVDGHFYGTSRTPYAVRDTIFRVTPAGVLTTLHTFDFTRGAAPFAIMQVADGTLFGSTETGGFTRTRGVIFRITTAGQYSAANMFLGSDPLLLSSSLLLGPDGAFYSASCEGGIFNAGTIYKMRPDGSQFAVLHSFAYWDGACPRGPLILGHDGALYGTTSQHGLGGRGTIFRITTSGSLTPVFFFNGTNGSRPVAGLLLASDGNYYGTTQFDGTNGAGGGTIFRLTPSGTFTTLHRFAGGFSEAPQIPLVQAGNGHLYGATLSTPFRLTLDGTVTLFNPVGGIQGALTPGADGRLYGVTVSAGAFLRGALFSLTLDGTITVLHSFNGDDGSRPYAGLLRGPDGALYGSTSEGPHLSGTLFRYGETGGLATLHEFSGVDGRFPFAQLALGPDGALYGTTLYGGSSYGSVIFRLKVQ